MDVLLANQSRISATAPPCGNGILAKFQEDKLVEEAKAGFHLTWPRFLHKCERACIT